MAGKKRADIQLLRAVAVLAVIGYHARVPGMGGGFTGVDIFFVISGFLITGKLSTELFETGRIRWFSFASARAARLLPNALLTLSVTLLLSYICLARYRGAGLAKDVQTAALFFGNIRFSKQSSDYFSSTDLPSAVLHFWSLNVEEQFYLVLPIALLVVSFVKGTWRKRVIGYGLALTAAVSFSLTVWTVHFNQNLAFFLLHTRAWEFAIGGLLALYIRPISMLGNPQLRGIIAWATFAGMLAGIVLISEDELYPNWITLAPTLCAAFFIAFAPDSRLLAQTFPKRSGLGLVGDWSYSLYLWHWPALVFAASSINGKVASPAVGVTIGSAIAIAVFYLVEEPLRKQARIGTRRTIVASACGLSVVAVAFGSAGYNRTINRHFPPSALDNEIIAARKDLPRSYRDGCHVNKIWDKKPTHCIYGNGEKTVLLFGDSHAAQWLEAIILAADGSGWRVANETKSGCPSISGTVLYAPTKSPFIDCDHWRNAVFESLRKTPPQAVIIANSSTYALDRYGIEAGSSKDLPTALKKTVSIFRGMGIPVYLIRDTPRMSLGVSDCLSKGYGDGCALPRETAMASSYASIPDVDPDVTLLDFTNDICAGPICSPVQNGRIAYRDQHHITSTFAATFSNRFQPIFALSGPQDTLSYNR